MDGDLALAITTLLARHLRFDAADPHWPDRDRLLLGASAPEAALPGVAERLPGAAPPVLATALGVALAERQMAAKFGRSLVDHRCWAVLDAAEVLSGAAQEAAAASCTMGLERLTAIVRAAPEHAAALARFAALGWHMRRAGAADADAIEAALAAAQRARRPTLIALHPDGSAAPATGTAPDIGTRGAAARRAWLRRLSRHGSREAFERAVAGTLPPGWQAVLAPRGPETGGLAAHAAATVTRLAAVAPELALRLPISPQALARALNGMALHRGVLPLAMASLAEAEGFGPALRLAAVRGLPTILLVLEPDVACPVGGLRSAWRAMVNVHVHRPADDAEMRACLDVALRRTDGPSVLLLHGAAASDVPPSDTRALCAQTDVRAPCAQGDVRALCAQGGYVAAEARGRRDLTLIASGAELEVARAARAALAEAGLAAAVVSLPCWELFARQPAWRRAEILGEAPRFGIEAGSGFGWERWLGAAGDFIGPDAGGKVSPEIVEHFVRRHLKPSNSLSFSAPQTLATATRIR